MRIALACWLLVGSLHAEEILRAAVLSADGKTLIVATSAALQWREPRSDKVIRSLARSGTRSLAISPDGRILAAGERTIFLFDSASGKPLGKLFGHTAAVHSLAFLPGGERLLSTDEAGQLRLWDLKTQKAIRAAMAHPRMAFSMALSPDGNTVAVATPQGVQLFEAATLQRGLPLRPRGSDQPVTAVAFNHDGRTLAALYADHCIRVWELATGEIRTARSPSRDLLHTLAFSPDGRTLLIGGERLVAWDLRADRVQPIGERRDLVPRALFPLAGGLLVVTEQGHFHEPRLPSRLEFKALGVAEAWEALDERDAERAYRGLWSLLHTREGVDHVVAQLRDVSAEIRARRQKIQQLIADLDHEDFPVREKASAALAKLGPDVYEDLETALRVELPLEQHRRIERLLRRMNRPSNPLPSGLLRRLRGIEVLEYANTPEAWAVLEKIATGDDPRLATAAKSSLTRRKK
jgi:hypothetical protein